MNDFVCIQDIFLIKFFQPILFCHIRMSKTTLPHTPQFAQAHDMIARAEKWLNENTVTNRVVKWETKRWGQIPADFGRKQH